MLRKIFRILFLVLFLSCACPAVVKADLGSIDKNESYDIYYGGDNKRQTFVVRRVKIVRIDQINSLEFLVFINDAGFNAKGKEGFILFSDISAIVPSSSFIISGSEQFKQ